DNPQLLTGMLFGYIKGAFTGANEDKEGLVKEADGGILFLDEIHRLSVEGQEMLFLLMDKGIYRRIGDSSRVNQAKVLIIGATTAN
ncbi:sigma-54 factor interaction domain-containing protein, partial [Desulfovibrio desulfuricans]|nr:sigma-54 factor interaction domain-containing protein [Desulfovibrio desulfuricans]